jgi:hypothetical protein
VSFEENLTICNAFAAGCAGLNSLASQLIKRLNMLGLLFVASGLVEVAIDPSNEGVREGSVDAALTAAGVETSRRSRDREFSSASPLSVFPCWTSLKSLVWWACCTEGFWAGRLLWDCARVGKADADRA